MECSVEVFLYRINYLFLNIMSESENCYEVCNSKYSAMQPERLFCKKGCDSDEDTM